tara:strand:+ start:11712 stop:28643 length:16932 start_codon:yes stop_codon:yes gene_type:complete
MSAYQGGYIGNTPENWEPGKRPGVWKAKDIQALQKQGELSRTAWSLKSAKYRPPFKRFDVSQYETQPTCVILNSTGSKMYVVGLQQAKILQFSLSTYWDVSTAVFDNVEFDLRDYEKSPTELAINEDNDRIYFVGTQNGKLYQIDLTTASDLSTGTIGKYAALQSTVPDIDGIYFSSGGGSLFVVSRSDDSITTFTLSTNFDISTITNGFQSTSKKIVGLSTNLTLDPITRQRTVLKGITQRGNPQGAGAGNYNANRQTSVWHDPLDVRPKSVSFNDDGTILFILGDNGEMYTWYLGTPFTPQSGSFNRFETTNPLILDESLESPQSLFMRPNGFNFYIADGSGVIAQYDLPAAYNVDKLTYDQERRLQVGNSPYDVQVSPDGKTMFVLTSDGNYRLKMYRTNRPFDFGRMLTDPRDMLFSYNGEYLYICDNYNIFRHELSTPWDITTATYTGNKFRTNDSPISEGNLEGITWKPDGTKLWICGYGQDRIFEFDVLTPWDLTTLQYNLVNQETTDESTPRDIGISTDGKTFMYAGERYLRTFFLTTPFTFADGVSQSNYTMDTRSLNGPDRYNIRAAKWSRDGKRLYIAYESGNNQWNTEVHQYRVQWAFHLDDMSHNNPQGMHVTEDGTHMYICDYDDHRVFQYHLSEPNEIRSAGFVTYFQVNNTSYRNHSGQIYGRYPTNPRGVGLSSDGNTLFVQGNYVVSQFALGTSFYVDSVGVGTTGYFYRWDDNDMRDIAFSYDGRKMFMIGEQHSRVYEFTLKFPYDINPTTSLRHPDVVAMVGMGTSTTWPSTSGYNGTEDNFESCAISTDGQYFYAGGTRNRSIYRYNLGIANSIKSMSHNQTFKVWNNYHGNKEYYPRGLHFSHDGRKMFICGNQFGGEAKQFNLRTAWSISTSSGSQQNTLVAFGGTFPLRRPTFEEHLRVSQPQYGNFEAQENNITNIRGATDGTKKLRALGIGSTGESLYVMGYNEAQIRRYPLSTSNYIRSAGFSSQNAYENYWYAGVGLVTSWCWRTGMAGAGRWYGGNPQNYRQGHSETEGRGLYVRPDGLKFYIAGSSADRIYEYNISTATPWNVDTVGYHTRQNMSQMTYSNFGIDIYGNSKTGLGTTTAYLYNIGIHDVQGIEFKPDGMKMYVTDTKSRSVWQFELAEAWKVGTANTGQEIRYYRRNDNAGDPHSGNRLIGFNTAVGIAKSFTLDVTWQNSENGSRLEYQPRCMRFNLDGTLMYVVGTGSDRPFVFELDEPWEIDTARYRNQKLTTQFQRTPANSTGFPGIGTVENNPYGMTWSRDGKHLYVVGDDGYMYDFENSLAWNTDYETDFSVQAGYGNSLYHFESGINRKAFPSGISTATDVQYNPDMDKMIVVGYSNSTGSEVKQYGTGTSMGRGNYEGTIALGNVSIGQSFRLRQFTNSNGDVRGSAFSTDGKYFYQVDYNKDRVFRYELVKPWNINSMKMSYDPAVVGYATTSTGGTIGVSSFYVGSQEGTPHALAFNHDGSRMYIGGNNDTIYQYNLPKNHYWGITSSVYTTSYNGVNSDGSNVKSIGFSTSGKRMYVATHSNSWVRQYWLDNPWEVNTANRRGEGNHILKGQANPRSFKWNNDGTKLFVLSDSRKEVFEYNLSYPYDVLRSVEAVSAAGTTRVNNVVGLGTTGFDVTDADASDVNGLAFNADGTKMYIVGLGSTTITQYGLSTAFNVRSATIEKTKNLYPDGLFPEEIGFNSTGSKMYVLDRKLDYLVEYNLGTNYDIATADLGNVGFASTATYSTLNFTDTTAGIALTDNNSALVQINASSTSNWNQAAVAAGSSFGAPFTMEYRVRANGSSTYNKMVGLTTIGDPDGFRGSTTNLYHTMAHGFYHQNHNNLGGGGISIRTKHSTNANENTSALGSNWHVGNEDIFRISYGVDGYIRHFINKVEVQRVYVGAGMSYHVGAYFNTDGAQLDDIRITNTGFTTSSDGYGNAFYMSRFESDPKGFCLSDNGINLNMVGTNQDRIYRFILDDDYRVGSAMTVGIDTFRGRDGARGFGHIGNMDSSPQCVGFNTDGTKAFILGESSDRIWQFDSAIKYQPLNVDGPEGYYFNIGPHDFGAPQEVKFSNDGKVMYVYESNNELHTYTLEKPWDLTSVNHDPYDHRPYRHTSNHEYQFKEDVYTFTVKSDTEDVIYFSDRYGDVYQMPANPRWMTPTDQQIQHLGFASEGKIAYVTGIQSAAITRYDLTTPYDIRTAERNREGQQFYTYPEIQRNPLKIRKKKYNPMYANNSGSNALWREANYRSLTFNYDGTKLYALGGDTETVFQYDLAQPYDTTTGVSVGGTFYVGYQEIDPEAIDFKPDGTKMYMVGTSSDRIFQYNLGQPWEVASAEYNGDLTRTTSPALDLAYKSLVTEDTQPREFIFNYDGSEGFMIGTQRNTVYKYTLSTPWDVDTLVATATTFTVVDYERASQGLFFKPDGSEMYVVGYGTTATYTSGLTSAMVSAGIATTMGNRPGNVHKFSLTVNWDIESAAFTTSFYVGNEENQPTQVSFNPEGTRMLIIGQQRDRMQTYDLSTAWDLDTAVYEPFNFNNYNDSQSSSDNRPQSFGISTTGKDLYMVEANNERIRQYQLSAPYQVRNLETTPRAFFWRADGLKLYIVGSSQDRVYSFTMTEAYNIRTMAFDGGYFYVGSEVGTPTGIFFEDDGLTMYISGHSNRLHQFDLDTAWDIKTTKNYRETGSGNYRNSISGVATTSFQLNNNRGSSPYGLGFSTDRSRFWWLDGGNSQNAVFEHYRQTTTGITSAYWHANYDNYDQYPQVDRKGNYDQNTDDRRRFNMGRQYPHTPEYVGFGSEGNIMYILHSSHADMIHQYHLPTPYRMNWYTEKPYDIGFSTDGQYFYVLGDDSKRINQIGVAGSGGAWNLHGHGDGTGYDIVHSTYNEADYLNLDIDIENDPRSFVFKPDGTKLYMLGSQRKRLYEYNLTTPWMVNTAGLGTTSYYMEYTDQANNESGGDVPNLGSPYGLRFHPDGTYMYCVDHDNYRVLQWEFGTQWDISTLGFKTDYNIDTKRFHFRSTNQRLRPRNLGFSTYGDKMFFIDSNNDYVVSFTLDTAWEVDSVGVGTTFHYVGNIENDPYALGFSTDGTRFFVAGHQTYLLNQYDMGNQSTAPGISSAWNVGIATTALWHGRKWGKSSPYMTGIGRSMNLAGPSIAGTFNVGPWETSPRSLHFSPNGDRMWLVGHQNHYVREFRFEKSNWDLRWSNNNSVLTAGSTTWQANNATYGHSNASSPNDFQWNENGSRFWILSDNTNKMHQWNVTQNWSMQNSHIERDFRSSAGTAISSRTLGNNSSPHSFLWSPDGTRLYVSETQNGHIYVYDAPNPFDISDLQAHFRYSNYYVGNEEYNVRGMAFATDGKKFFTVGNQDHWYVTQYDMPVPYEFTRRGVNESANAIAIHTEGTRIWFQGEFRDQIYQHDIDTPWNIGVRRMAGGSNNYAFPRVGLDSTGISTTPTVIGRGINRVISGMQSSVYVGQDIIDPRGMALAGGAADGQRFFALNYDNTGKTDLIQYNVTNKWDFDGVSIGASFKQVGMYVESNYGSSGFITERYNTDLTFSTNGQNMYIVGQEYDRVYQYYLGAAFNINTIYGDDFLGIGTTSIYYGMQGNPHALGFTYDGTKAYIAYDNTEMVQYDLHVAWDLRSGYYRQKRREFNNEDIGNIQGIRLTPDSKAMYVLDSSSDRIHYYEFLEGFEGELTHMYRAEPNEAQFYVGNDENEPYGFDISADGKHLAIIGRQRDRVQKYDMRSPWETRTSSQSDSKMVWKYDGSKLFVYNQELERVESFTIENEADYWDLSKAGFDTGNYMTVGGPVNNSQYLRTWDNIEWQDSNNSTSTQSYRYVWSQEYDNTGNKMFQWTSYDYELNENDEVDVRQLSLGTTSLSHTGIFTGSMFGFAGIWNDRYHNDKLGINTNTGINTTSSNTGMTGNTFDMLFSGVSSPLAVAFSTDGSKMFVTDDNKNKVFYYPLSTPWNVGSATTVGVALSFFIGDHNGTPRDITFNYDGSRMYTTNSSNDRIHQYDLDTNYAVGGGNTVSVATTYVQAYNTGDGGGDTVQGMFWKPDGTKFYTADSGSDRIFQYNLATAWDITTVQNENDGVGLGTTSFYLGYEENQVRSVAWNADGTKLIIHGRDARYKGGDRLHEYNASVAYAVTSLSYSGYRTNRLDGYYSSHGSGWHWHPDGDRVYMVGQQYGNAIVEYRLTTNWSARAFHRHGIEAAGFGSEGTKFYTASKDSYAVYEWDLDTAYEVGSGVTWSGKRFVYGPSPTGKRFHYGWQENNAYGVAFSTTGDNIYVAGQDNKVYQYKLGTNWDISSRRTGTGDTASATFSGTEGTNIYSVQFSKDGTKVYFVKDEDGIVQHTLSTAWDITSADTTMGTSAGLGTTAFSVNNGNTDDERAGISTLENNPRALAFSYDGSKMYFAGTSQDTIYQYTLTTPWDITTAGVGTGVYGFTTSTYIGYWANSPSFIGLSSDGTKLFTSCDSRRRVFMQTLSTPYDVGTASTVVGFTTDYREFDSSYRGCAFDELGERMYIYGNNNDMIHEFDLPNPWEVKTAFESVKCLGISTHGDKLYLSGITTAGNVGSGLRVAAGVGTFNKEVWSGINTLGILSTGILEYNMTTPWDSSSISGYHENYNAHIFSDATGGTGHKFAFSGDGKNIMVLNWRYGWLSKLGLTTAWNVSELIPRIDPVESDSSEDLHLSGSTQNAIAFTKDGRILSNWRGDRYTFHRDLSGPYILENTGDNHEGLYFKEDGLTCWINDSTFYKIRKFDLSEAYNLRTGIYTGHYWYYGAWGSGRRSLHFKPDGTKFYLAYESGYLQEHKMTTPWDVRTAHANWQEYSRAELYYSEGGNNVRDIIWRPDGSEFYSLGVNSVRTFKVPDPWNISGPKDFVDQYVQWNSQIPNQQARGLHVGAGGSMFYIVGWSSAIQYKVNHNSNGRSFNPDTIVRIDNSPQGCYISTEGNYMYVVGTERDWVHQMELKTNFDVGTAEYMKKSFYIGQMGGSPTDLELSPDGKYLYWIEDSNNRICQVPLRTPFMVDTANAERSRYLRIPPNREDSLTGLTFTPDGKKLYFVGSNRDCIFEYDLDVAWEITTAGIDTSSRFANDGSIGYGKSFSFRTQESSPTAVAIGSTGTYIYVTGTSNDFVRGYHLPTPFDISSASIGSTLNTRKYIGELETSPTGIAFGIGGTTMYIVGTSSDRIHQYDMSEPWNIGVATNNHKYTGRFDQQLFYDGGLRVGQQEATNPSAIGFNTDGTRFFFMGYENDRIYQYTINKPYDLNSTAGIGSTALLAGVEQDTQLINNDSYYIPGVRDVGFFDNAGQQYGVGFKTDGSRMFTLGISSISQYNLYANWRITNIGEISVTGMQFKPDGNNIFVLGTNERRIYKFNLSTPFDLTTASIANTATNSFYIGTFFSESSPRDLRFTNDGTEFFLTGDDKNLIYKYEMTTAWDVSTAGIAATFGTRTKRYNKGAPYGLGISSEKNRLFLAQNDDDTINEIRLHRGNNDFYVPNETRPTASYVSIDGTKLFWVGERTGSVFSIDLSIPFDLTSANGGGKTFYVGGQDTLPSGMDFSDDGTKMYISGMRSGKVYVYELSRGFDLDTARFTGETLDLNKYDAIISSVHVSTDGKRLFAMGTNKGRVIPFDLTDGL